MNVRKCTPNGPSTLATVNALEFAHPSLCLHPAAQLFLGAHVVVYRFDCRYLPYSIHSSSEFMPIFFTRKRTKHEDTRSPRDTRKSPPTVTRRAKHYWQILWSKMPVIQVWFTWGTLIEVATPAQVSRWSVIVLEKSEWNSDTLWDLDKFRIIQVSVHWYYLTKQQQKQQQQTPQKC